MEGKKTTKTKSTSRLNSAVKKLKLLITIVNRNKAEYYADLIQNYEVNFQTVLQAQGTANTEMLNHLGLVGSEKAVVLSVVREDKVKPVLSELKEKFSTIKNGRGIAYTVPLSSVIGVSVYGFLSNNKQTVKE